MTLNSRRPANPNRWRGSRWTNPSDTTRNSKRRHLPDWALIVAALALAVTVATGIIGLNRHADDRRRFQALVERVHGQVHMLGSTYDQVRSIVSLRSPEGGPLPENLAVRAEDQKNQIRDSIDQIQRLDDGDGKAGLIQTQIENYLFLSNGEFSDGVYQPLTRDTVTAEAAKAFGAVHTMLTKAGSETEEAANQVHKVSNWSVFIIQILTVGVLGFLVWNFGRARRMAEERVLRKSESSFRLLFSANPHPMFVFDQQTYRLLEVNEAAIRCYGYTHDEFRAMKVSDLRAVEQANDTQYYPELEETISRRPVLRRHQQKDGRLVDVEIVSQKIDSTERPTVLMVAHDITERKALESQLFHQAFHDTLSNLPNRALFLDRLQHSLARAARRGRRVSVMFLDLDNFKVINDSLGHQAGDTLLVTIAQRLLSTIRPEDIVARLGGDEFTILLDDVVSEDDAIQVANRIAEELRVPVKLGTQGVFVTTSIGIAVSNDDHNDAEKLLRAADLAMYQAKSAGKARYGVFDPSMDTKAIDRLQLEIDLRGAIEREEIQLFYQPILSLDTGEIVEVEALSRWNHPIRGLVPPTVFIPVAEETGLILPLSRWVMREACLQTKIWQDENPDREPLTVAVNVSARDVRDPGFLDFVFDTLRETRLSSSSLKIEITETVAIDDAESAAGTLQMLRDIGVRIAIDDFGTGYSSLSYLQRFPATSVKIDRAFVERLEKGSPEDSAIVDTIISLARTLNMDVVGEGIESMTQLNQLQKLGCTMGQGFYFAKPMAPESIGPLLGISQVLQAA